MGFAGYPTLRLMTLVETGTRGLLGATLGSANDCDETSLARRLLGLLRPGMLVLLDRGFDANAFFADIAATGAMLLARAKFTRRPPVLTHLPDGSYLSDLGGLAVRIIEAELTMTGSDGSRVREGYRLITTLLDPCRYPAHVLVQLYHERWEIESAYLALRHTLLDAHVLRSGDRPALEQEVWALLTVYQLLRMAMVTAVETRPCTNPDRASFTTALQAAKDQLTTAAGVCADQPVDLLGVIGRAVLATLLPARRPRYSARRVKSPPAATTTATTPVPPCRPPSPPSPSRCTPHRSTPPPHRLRHIRPRHTAVTPGQPHQSANYVALQAMALRATLDLRASAAPPQRAAPLTAQLRWTDQHTGPLTQFRSSAVA